MEVPCFECGKSAVHNHHVVPQVHGGTRTVPLCLKCHGLIHDKNFVRSNALQRAGIDAVRAANGGKCTWGGRKPGQKVKATPERVATILSMKAAGDGVSKIARAVDLTRPTVYAVLKQSADPKSPAV